MTKFTSFTNFRREALGAMERRGVVMGGGMGLCNRWKGVPILSQMLPQIPPCQDTWLLRASVPSPGKWGEGLSPHRAAARVNRVPTGAGLGTGRVLNERLPLPYLARSQF